MVGRVGLVDGHEGQLAVRRRLPRLHARKASALQTSDLAYERRLVGDR